jgi:TolB-like protein/Tfp pilus assembly protein PilF
MSPEQVQGEKVDHRSDIFSLGVVLYEMITGHLPFAGEYDAAVVYSIINDTPEPLARYKSDIPERIQQIASKMLEKDSQLRYQHVDDLIADLKKARSESEKPPQPVRRILIPVSAILAVIVLFLIFKPWRVIVEPDQRAIAAENRLAIMYFDNLADPEDSQKLGEIATNLLITDLSESRYLQVVSSQRLYDILKLLGREGQKRVDQDVASQVAEKAKAKWMLLGSILQVEPKIIITTQLVEVTNGNTVASQRVAADDNEDIFSLVDNLTLEIKNDLSLPATAREEPDPLVADVTTTSPEAYRYYIEGLDFDYKYYPNEAKASFQKALEYDSTFAMAYYRLYNISGYNNIVQDRRFLDKALAYSDKVTQREKLLIKSAELSESKKYDQASYELRKLIALYPEDKEAHVNMSGVYSSMNKPLEAINELEAAIEIDSLYKDAYNYLAYNYSYLGDLEKAIWAINKYISVAPDEANPYDTRGDIYREHGKISKAIESYEKALEIKPDFLFSLYKLGELYIMNKRYIDA